MGKIIDLNIDDRSFLASALDLSAQAYPSVPTFIKEMKNRVKSNTALETDSEFLLDALAKAEEKISKCFVVAQDPIMMETYREKMVQVTELQKKIKSYRKKPIKITNEVVATGLGLNDDERREIAKNFGFNL